MDDNQGKEKRPVRRVDAAPEDNPHNPPGTRGYAPPQQRDLFPYVMSGLITAAIIGLVLVVWLAASPRGGISPTSAPPTPIANAPREFPTAPVPLAVVTGAPGEVPTIDIAAPLALPTGSPPPADDPPRIPLGEFNTLYKDPATRPIILDTRGEAAFKEGHIPGAILFPSDQVATNVAQLPKDKPIIAYCQ